MIAYCRGPKHKDPPIAKTTHNFISDYWSGSTRTIRQKNHSQDRITAGWTGGGIATTRWGQAQPSLAKKLDRQAIGKIEERYCEIAAKRMGQEVLDFDG